MLSRVSERIYWTGRYMERMESMARLIQTYSNLLLDLPDSNSFSWSNLLSIVHANDSFAKTGLAENEKNLLHHFITDTDHTGSIISCMAMARENMRTLREIIPREGWQCVNEFYLFMKAEVDQVANRPRRRANLLALCIEHSQLMNGLLASTMSHNQAYQFLTIGRHLERADMTSRIVDVAAASLAPQDDKTIPFENTLWMAVLKSVSAYQMYRQHLRRRVSGEDVVGYLLADRLFPRSVLWNTNKLIEDLEQLPRASIAVEAATQIAQTIENSLPDLNDSRALHDLVDRLQKEAGQLHNSIQTTWFLQKTKEQTHELSGESLA